MTGILPAQAQLDDLNPFNFASWHWSRAGSTSADLFRPTMSWNLCSSFYRAHTSIAVPGETGADLICTWSDEGVQVTTIHQALIERYGFTGSYDSVRRLLKSHQKSAPVATVFLDHPPAETAQIDFGADPVITDVHTGEVMKTWFFVMTLPCSKHMYAELITNQRVETWLGCHRRTFEHFGGTPLKTVIDNPKYDIARVCYESKVLRA